MIAFVKQYRFGVFSLVTFSFLLGFGLFSYYMYISSPPSAPKQNEFFSPSREKTKWLSYMQRVGGQKAYNEFKKKYQKSSYTRQHVAMHNIGEILYKLYGIDGLPVCDATFAYGCYHGFFGAAIFDKGLSQITMMDEACIKKLGRYSTGCQHGMGHGILAYLGNNKLLEALQTCDKLQVNLPIGGCKGGVFMEYNFSTIRHDGSTQVRPLNPLLPYSPCDAIPMKYQYTCYYSQPEWWNKVYNKDAKKIGNLCENTEPIDKSICYLGLGGIAAQTTHFTISKTKAYCNQIDAKMGKMLCMAGALWMYKISHQHISDIHTFCESVSSDLVATCIKESKILQ